MSLYAVTRENGEPLYIQIARLIEKQVAQLYAPGDCLPSETELALRFGVNRHTLRHAIDELVEQGLLERWHGRGVFVLDSHLVYPIGAATRFTENLHALGLPSDNAIVRKQILPSHQRVAERLGIANGTPVIWLETLRAAEERPLCVISHFVPADRFPELAENYSGGSLHGYLKRVHGCKLRRSESFVTAVLPQGDDARLLGIPQNRPVLRVKSVNVDGSGIPVEYAITRFRADRIQLRINP